MGWFARGMGNGLISVADEMYKENARQQESDLMVERARMIDEIKAARENTERTERSGRIESQQRGLLDQAVVDNAKASTAANSTGQFKDEDGNIVEKDLGSLNRMMRIAQQMPEGKERDEVIAQIQKQAAESKAKAGKISLESLTDEQRQKYAPNEDQKLSTYLEASIKTGDLSPKEAATVLAQERAAMIAQRRTDLEASKFEHRANIDSLKLDLQRDGLDLQSRRLDAMLAKISANGASGSANSDWYHTIKSETGWDPEKVLTYMATAKAPVPTEKKTVEDDGFGGKKEKVTTTGPAEQKPAAASGKPWERKW